MQSSRVKQNIHEDMKGQRPWHMSLFDTPNSILPASIFQYNSSVILDFLWSAK